MSDCKTRSGGPLVVLLDFFFSLDLWSLTRFRRFLASGSPRDRDTDPV